MFDKILDYYHVTPDKIIYVYRISWKKFNFIIVADSILISSHTCISKQNISGKLLKLNFRLVTFYKHKKRKE